MAMVNVGVMCVGMPYRLMLVRMCVWLRTIPFEVVRVLVVRIMAVAMRMR